MILYLGLKFHFIFAPVAQLVEHLTSSKSDKTERKFICRMVPSSFEDADFFIDEPIFLRNMRIFKKKSAKYREKSALPNLVRSILLRLGKSE